MKRFIFSLALLALAAGLRAADVVFIAHPDTPQSSLTADEAKAVLTGAKVKWDGGGAIKLTVLAEGATHEQVVRDFTQRTPDQFDKFWKKLVFTGKGVMPTVAKTEAEAVDLVAKTPGAFGYVSKENVSPKVKVLPVK